MLCCRAQMEVCTAQPELEKALLRLLACELKVISMPIQATLADVFTGLVEWGDGRQLSDTITKLVTAAAKKGIECSSRVCVPFQQREWGSWVGQAGGGGRCASPTEATVPSFFSWGATCRADRGVLSVPRQCTAQLYCGVTTDAWEACVCAGGGAAVAAALLSCMCVSWAGWLLMVTAVSSPPPGWCAWGCGVDVFVAPANSATLFVIGELHAIHGRQLSANSVNIVAAIVKKHCKSSEVSHTTIFLALVASVVALVPTAGSPILFS
jgi:hypothetical protein